MDPEWFSGADQLETTVRDPMRAFALALTKELYETTPWLKRKHAKYFEVPENQAGEFVRAFEDEELLESIFGSKAREESVVWTPIDLPPLTL